MIVLAIGLVLFVGIHMVPMMPRLRGAVVARIGVDPWRGIHSVVAAVGLGLIVWGFGRARAEGLAPWLDGVGDLRWLAVLVLAPVFPLLLAAHLPGRVAATVRHPMVTAVILWAFAHLLIVVSAPAILLFATFLAWSLADRVSLTRRATADRAPPPPFGLNDVVAVGLGLALWAVTIGWAHLWLIGVAPLP